MNEVIRKRKSIRKYEPTPLDTDVLEKVEEQLKKVTPLYPNIRYSIEIASKTRGLFNIKAPHYLIFGSEEKNGSFENIGFIGQQLDLFFSESGIGACWLGASKPQEKEVSALPCVICMSFGKPAEPVYRNLADFKRKSLIEISEGNDDRLEAPRLAPSGMNKQNWYFIADKGEIHCYWKKALLGFMNKLSCIDMGIAICHIAAETEDFHFTHNFEAPVRKGYVYMGTVISGKETAQT